MPLHSRNPATNELLAHYDVMSDAEAAATVSATYGAFTSWQALAVGARVPFLKRAAQIMRAETPALAKLITQEMGKPITQARAEIEKCAWACDYYAEHAEAFLASETIETNAQKSYVVYQPLGVVLAIMPWNFPFWQVWRFAAPSLMAGNGVLLKHAENVTGCALALADIIRRAGFPEGIFSVLRVEVKQIEALIAHPSVAAVTLTGSTRAGKAVAAQAGANLKKTVLELGGSDPYIVLEDAALDAAVDACATGRMLNGGQSCIAAKRFIVVKPQLEAFTAKLLAKLKTFTLGDPMDEATTLGPLARPDLRDRLHKQVLGSVKAGAKLLLGGSVPALPGSYYPATLLTHVLPGMPAFDEETFGPLAVITEAEDEAAALSLAGQTPYGLGAAVFTEDLARGERLALALQAGSVFVNTFVKSDPRLPFGGVKASGYGRELSLWGARAFVNAKTVYIA